MLQFGAQNQNTVGLSASVVASSSPPPTSGAVNCSASGAAWAGAGAGSGVASVGVGSSTASPMSAGVAAAVPAGAVSAVASAAVAAGVVTDDVAGAVSDAEVSPPDPLHAAAMSGSTAMAANARVDLTAVTLTTLQCQKWHGAQGFAGVSNRRRPDAIIRHAGPTDTAAGRHRAVAWSPMKTRTLLLLSVGTALMILLAGGALLFQLSSQESTSAAIEFGTPARVGDLEATVVAADVGGDTLSVSVIVSGVDDIDGIESFRVVTGDQRLDPIAAPADGRCAELTVERQECVIDFDVSASQGTSRVLVLRRGEDQATWRLD